MNKIAINKWIDAAILAMVILICMLLFQGLHIRPLVSGALYLASGAVVYKIAMEMGMGRKKSELCAFVAVSMPIGLYCQFVLGQSRIILVLLMLVGFFFWLKENTRLFLLFFAAAFCFGMPALPVFVTLLLLKEKRLYKIAGDMVLFLLPSIAKLLWLLRDAEYREGFLAGTSLDIAGAQLQIGAFSVNLMLVLVLAVMMYSYTKEIGERTELAEWAVYLIGLQMFAMFGMGNWKPEWLVCIVPFLALGAFMHRDTKIFMLLDLALMLFFVLYVVNEFAGAADDALLKNGILGGRLTEGIVNRVQIRDVLIMKDTGMVMSFFATLMLVIAVFKHPSYCLADVSTELEKGTVGAIRLRYMGGMAIFLLPALLCFWVALKPPYVTLYTPDRYADISPMVSGRQNSEVFIATKGELESVEFCIGTYARETDVDITVRITDATNEEILLEKIVSAEGYSNYDWVYVDTAGLQLLPGGTYRLDIVCEDADEGNYITLYRTKNLEEQTHGYAFIDGERQDYHLCIRLIEGNLPQ